jgi:hypothetical protein
MARSVCGLMSDAGLVHLFLGRNGPVSLDKLAVYSV